MARVLSLALTVAPIVAPVLALLSTPPAHADAGSAPRIERTAYMRVFGQAAPPYGFVQFCERSPEECAPAANAIADGRFNASPERLAELDEINRAVNTRIEPATDQELYGVEEYWTLPVSGKGDCEDYALLKRHLLVKRGWPLGSLLMTVVRDEKGDGHAILTARTAQGDFILDNKVPTVKPWHATGYQFIMRQSYLNPRLWMALDPNEGQAPLAISGLKQRR